MLWRRSRSAYAASISSSRARRFHGSTLSSGSVGTYRFADDEFGRSLGADVSRRVRKYYIGYFAGKRSFFTIEVQRQRLVLSLNLDPTTTTPWNEEAMRDVREIGRFGLGDTEYSLRTPEQVDEAKALIQQAYDRTS